MKSGNATAVLTPVPAREFSTKPDKSLTVMVLRKQDGDIAALLGVLERCGYNIAWSTTLSDGLAALRTVAVPVVICGRSLPDGNWKDLLQQISSFDPAPLVIVSARNADERFWADVLCAGGYDLLPEPFEGSEVIRSLNLAIQYWQETQIFRRSHIRRSA